MSRCLLLQPGAASNLMSTQARENIMASIVTQQRQADGSPLYAYKWHDEDYERLKATVREQMHGALRGREDRRFAAMFCVWLNMRSGELISRPLFGDLSCIGHLFARGQ
jgi:hypothetical protein